MDWTSIIKDLESSDLTQVEIGRLCGCSQSMVADIKRGARGERIGYNIGTRLLALWRERCAGGSKDAMPPVKEAA